VVVFRGGTLAAQVTLSRSKHDEMLKLCYVAAQAFDADQIGLVCETFSRIIGPDGTPIPHPFNPDGAWPDGSIETLLREHAERAYEWLTEALMIVVANRAGDVMFQTQPFHYDEGRLVIDEPTIPFSTLTPERPAEGLTIEALRQAMLRPSNSQVTGITDAELPLRERDLMSADVIAQHFPCQVMLARVD
jgi:hypothetical protein